jgi:hypothetical protein
MRDKHGIFSDQCQSMSKQFDGKDSIEYPMPGKVVDGNVGIKYDLVLGSNLVKFLVKFLVISAVLSQFSDTI